MQQSYDSNSYRALGVGDKILKQHYRLWNDGVCFPVESEWIGQVVLDSTPYTFLEQLPGAVITKTAFATGATRSDATGRGRFDLIPYEAMLSLAKRYEMGAVHFGENNWLKGQPLSRLLSSMRRHAHQINYDFSEDHVGAVLWNAAAFVTMVARMEAGILPKTIDDIGYFTNREVNK